MEDDQNGRRPKWKKSPKSKKGKSKKGKSKKGKKGKKTAKWKKKSPKHKKGKKTPKYKHVKSPKRTPKSPKWKSSKSKKHKHKTHKHKHKSWWNDSADDSGSRRRRSGSDSGSGKRWKHKGKRGGSPPQTPKWKKKPKTQSPKWKPEMPSLSPVAKDYSGARCGVVGVWCMVNKPIREFGFTTVNEFEGELYYFNERWTAKNWDIEKTSIIYDSTTNEHNFFPDIATTNTKRTAKLNADKTVLTYSDGTIWYRQGSDECNALLPFNIDIDDVYPAVTPRSCGAEYKYHFDWIKQSLERLLNTKLVSGDVNVYLRGAIRKMVIDFRANPTSYQFCSGFDASVATAFGDSFSGGFYLRERFELSQDTFGMDWREFITYMYQDVLEAKQVAVDVTLDFSDFVRADFNTFFTNRQSFYDKAAVTLAQVGVYRPNTVTADREFNLLLSSLKKRFSLGLPFCDAIDTTYREVASLVDESTDRFTSSVANFGNSVRYYIEEFILEVFNVDNNFCQAVNNVADNSWGFDMSTESTAVYGHIATGVKLAKAAFANDDVAVRQFASQLFNDLEFSAFADQTVDIDFTQVIRTAFGNINLGSTKFDFINGDDTMALNEAFFARVGTMINSFADIADIATTCRDTPNAATTIFTDFVDETLVFPEGFCDAAWTQNICSTFNAVVDRYNNVKLEFDLFESDTLADIADKVSNKIDQAVSGLSAKVGLLQKGRQLAKKVVENFNEARTRLAPLDKVKQAFVTLSPKLTTFTADVAALRADCETANAASIAAGGQAIFNFDGDAWTMMITLEVEAKSWLTNGAPARKRRSAVKSRRRRSFNDLDYNDIADRHILRQHVPFFSEFLLFIS